MRLLGFIIRFLTNKRLAGPAILIAINLGSSFMAFRAGDYRRGVYFLASGVCIAMVAI
jgi:hypothetical protein